MSAKTCIEYREEEIKLGLFPTRVGLLFFTMPVTVRPRENGGKQ